MTTNTLTLSKSADCPNKSADMDEGILYVSTDWDVAIHLCPCGCRNEVVTSLDASGWKFTESNGLPTLHPSVRNRFECKSHYWVRNGQVIWV